MAPVEVGEGTGLIRLHSTYRHDLKIYSSDEGRVQVGRAMEREGEGNGFLTAVSPPLVALPDVSRSFH